MATVMIVDAEQLPDAPKAFRDYVERYFRERRVLGKRVFVATQYLYLDDRSSRGCAPGHNVDLQCFTDGLPPGQSLNEWMRRAAGTYLWTFEGGYDSNNVVHDD